MSEGLKYDAGKLRLELIPPSAVLSIGAVMTYGAQKYAPDSWRGVEVKRYQGALMRHWYAYLSGEVYDQESGLPHIEHVLTNAAFINELERSHREPIRLKTETYPRDDYSTDFEEDD